MKVLVTGAAGMLANAVIPELKSSGYEVIPCDINAGNNGMCYLDVSKKEEISRLMKEYKPDYIFHFAAETNVDLCQEDHSHALKVNSAGTENIAMTCKEHNIPLLYMSTSAVFWGDKETPYVETDATNPVNFYSKTKLDGEKCVQNLLKKYFIVRAGWMVGGWEIDKKFVYKIVQQLKDGKRQLRVVNDKFGSMTFTVDFAKNLIPLLKTEKYGLYHMANKGRCSRYDIAVKIVELMGLKGKVEVLPISSDEFPLPAPRSNSETLENAALKNLGIDNMPPWEDSLADYIRINKDK